MPIPHDTVILTFINVICMIIHQCIDRGSIFVQYYLCILDRIVFPEIKAGLRLKDMTAPAYTGNYKFSFLLQGNEYKTWILLWHFDLYIFLTSGEKKDAGNGRD